MSRNQKVLIIEDSIYADLISHGVYASRVQYYYGGVLHDVIMENNELEFLDSDMDIEEENE